VEFIGILPGGMVAAFSHTCRVKWIRITNPSDSTITVAVWDRQPTPICIIPKNDIPPGGVITYKSEYVGEEDSERGDLCACGLNFWSSASGLHAYAKAF
jgi:hypothetical protein